MRVEEWKVKSERGKWELRSEKWKVRGKLQLKVEKWEGNWELRGEKWEGKVRIEGWKVRGERELKGQKWEWKMLVEGWKVRVEGWKVRGESERGFQVTVEGWKVKGERELRGKKWERKERGKDKRQNLPLLWTHARCPSHHRRSCERPNKCKFRWPATWMTRVNMNSCTSWVPCRVLEYYSLPQFTNLYTLSCRPRDGLHNLFNCSFAKYLWCVY